MDADHHGAEATQKTPKGADLPVTKRKDVMDCYRSVTGTRPAPPPSSSNGGGE